MPYTKTVFVEPGDKRSRQVIRKETRESHPGAKVRILRVSRIVDAPAMQQGDHA